MSTCMDSKHVHVEDIVKIKIMFNKGAFYWSTLNNCTAIHSTINIKICTPHNNKLSELKSPYTFLVSNLTIQL
jgi:hypothetical protein